MRALAASSRWALTPFVGCDIKEVESAQTFVTIPIVLREKQAYKIARTLLKDYALECITEEIKRRNLPHSPGQKMQAETLREIIAQTENFATHWAQFPARGLFRVKDLEGYVKRKLVAAGDFKDLRKRVISKFLQCPLLTRTPRPLPILDVKATLNIPRTLGADA